MIEEPGSFRDPAGKIFYLNGKIFRKLNDTGKERIKYILSNTDAKNCDVLENLKERLQNDYATEFTNCCRQIEKIALEKLFKINRI